MPEPQSQNTQKLVHVPDTGVVAFPASMPDDQIVGHIRAFKKQGAPTPTDFSPNPGALRAQAKERFGGLATEQSEHRRQMGNVPEVTPDWNTVRQAVSKATEPTLPNANTTPANSSWAANRDAAWNAGVNAANVGGNVLKRAGRFLFGVVDMPAQVSGIVSRLFSPDEKVSQQAEGELLALHPGAQIADRLKEGIQDWRKSKSLAAENAVGDLLGFFLLSKAGKTLPEARIKQLEAEGVVLPPEAKPKAPAELPKTPPQAPTIEGQFQAAGPSTPVGIEPVEAAAKLTRNEPPKLPEAKAEAAELALQPKAKTLSEVKRPSFAEPDLSTAEVVFSANWSPDRLYRGTNGEDELQNILSSQAIASTSETASRLGKSGHQGMTFFSDHPNVATSYVHDGGYVIEVDASKVPETTRHGAGEIATTKPTPLSAITRVFKVGKDEKGYHAVDVTSRVLPAAEPETAQPVDAQMNLKYTGAGGAQPFYLKSEKILADKMRGPMPAADVQKMLAANGVKDEEMKWTGLDDFLKEKGNEKVTPQEINEFNATHDLQIEEVQKGTGQPPQPRAYAAIKEWGAAKGYDNDVENGLAAIRRGDVQGGTGDLEMLGAPDDLLEPFRQYAQGEGGAKYGSWQLPGGQNYRELLVTMPERPPGPVLWKPASWNPDRLDGTSGGRKFSITKEADGRFYVDEDGGPLGRKLDTLEAAKKAVEEELHGRSPVGRFRSHHWDEPNVMAHVRFNDRYTSADGTSYTPPQKILHIEELQSDWHQKGRTQGYQQTRVPTKATRYGGYWEVHDQNGDFITNIQDWQHPEVKTQEQAIQVAEHRLQSEPQRVRSTEAVPDAPFKKTWPELLLKRMLKYAVDNGYDGVTWTPGEEQAERYDLSKQVKELFYYPDTQRLIAYDHGNQRLINEVIPPDKLPDTIGKDAAKKLLEAPPLVNRSAEETADRIKDLETRRSRLPLETTPESLETLRKINAEIDRMTKKKGMETEHYLGGIDLKVGGEGMKGFYDKIVPDAMNKIAKKFGTKVGTIDLGGARYGVEQSADLSHWRVVDQNGKVIGGHAGHFDSRERALEAARAAQEEEPPNAVPYLPITPEMRAGVKAEPFALFKLIYKPEAATQPEIADAWRQLGDVRIELEKNPPPKDPDITHASPAEIEKWKAGYKAWAERSEPWMQKYRQAAQQIEDLKNRQIGQIRQLPDGKIVLYLNRDGLNGLYHAMHGGPRPEYTLSGVSLSPQDTDAVIRNLATLKPPLHQQLTEMIRRGMDKNGITISMIPEKGQNMREALATLREELNHGWQKNFADAAGNHLAAAQFKELNAAMPQPMANYIGRNYPEMPNDGSELTNRQRVFEASAKMLSEAPVTFGLTEDEAAAYLFQYFHAVEEAHGAKALDELVHITVLAKEIKNDYFNAGRPSGGSEKDAGSVRGVQEGRVPRAEGTAPPAQRGTPAGTGTGAGTAASLEPLKKQAETPQPLSAPAIESVKPEPVAPKSAGGAAVVPHTMPKEARSPAQIKSLLALRQEAERLRARSGLVVK